MGREREPLVARGAWAAGSCAAGAAAIAHVGWGQRTLCCGPAQAAWCVTAGDRAHAAAGESVAPLSQVTSLILSLIFS